MSRPRRSAREGGPSTATQWVNGFTDGTVAKLRLNGQGVASSKCGAQPTGISFDGVSMWTVDEGPGTVTKE